MATLTPYSPQPLASSSRSPSPVPEYITYATSETDYQDSTRDHDTVPLTGRGPNRPSSPTPSELIELKEYDGTLIRAFRKKSWKNKGFLSGSLSCSRKYDKRKLMVSNYFSHSRIDYRLHCNSCPLLCLSRQNRRSPYARRCVGQENSSRVLDPRRLDRYPVHPACEFARRTPNSNPILTTCKQLFGAEIIQLLCGFIYGLWLGFLIVCGALSNFLSSSTMSDMISPAAGTVLGETINFFLFRTCLRSRAEKIERGKDSPRWGALARVIREGGFWMALAVRFSAFPTHGKPSVSLSTANRY